MRLLDTLMMCPACGRWWKYREQHQDAADKRANHYGWTPVSAWDIPARHRIAAHETEMYGSPFRWWECHPNPNRGRS